MKKGTSGLLQLRQASSLKEQRKDDHFSYFENLEQKLLQQSDKITNLIGLKALNHSETRSLKDTLHPHSRLKTSEAFSQEVGQSDQEREEVEETKASMLVQSLLQKKKLLSSSKSQYFGGGKQKEGQLQRKLTYNMVRPQEGESSPSKSEYHKEALKMTASTTSSSAVMMRTIDKIKRMSAKAKGGRQLKESREGKGMSVQDFQIIRYMQEGQFGTVYLSRHKATNFLCALKKIPKRIFQGEQRFINQLVREIKIQSYLDHPNIVQLYTFFCDEESLYLILQLCCGGNVYNTLRSQGRFTQQKTRSVIKQVCHAIQFMHDSDIIHRDIKPENILFHENIIKVCDFGWSIHSPLMRETRCGTPLYSSPEVVQKQQYDNKVDVWNIGILAYQLLFGRVPFEIRTEDDLVKVVDEEIYFSKGIPVSQEAKDFILSCLHKNPKDRLTMNKLVDHPFIHRTK